MDAGLQRTREHSGWRWERRRAGNLLDGDGNLYEWMTGLLEPDERLMLPEDYVNNWTMYDQVCGSGYFITDDNAANPEQIDFAWEGDLRRMKREGVDMDRITVIDKVMIVRLRLPWNIVDTEWLATEDQLIEHGEDWEILEIYIRARRKDRPNEKPRLLLKPKDRRAYEAAPDEYEVVEKNYLVAWKMSPETRERLLR